MGVEASKQQSGVGIPLGDPGNRTISSERYESQSINRQSISRINKNIRQRITGGVSYNLKIIIRGKRNVGKTLLFRRLKGMSFISEYIPTPEIQTATINWTPNEEDSVENVKVEVWDIVDRGLQSSGATAMITNNLMSPESTIINQQLKKGHHLPNGEYRLNVLDASMIDVYQDTNAVLFVINPFDDDSIEYVRQSYRKVPYELPILILQNFRDKLAFADTKLSEPPDNVDDTDIQSSFNIQDFSIKFKKQINKLIDEIRFYRKSLRERICFDSFPTDHPMTSPSDLVSSESNDNQSRPNYGNFQTHYSLPSSITEDVHTMEVSMANCYGLSELYRYITIPFLRLKQRVLEERLYQGRLRLEQAEQTLEQCVSVNSYEIYLHKYENLQRERGRQKESAKHIPTDQMEENAEPEQVEDSSPIEPPHKISEKPLPKRNDYEEEDEGDDMTDQPIAKLSKPSRFRRKNNPTIKPMTKGASVDEGASPRDENSQREHALVQSSSAVRPTVPTTTASSLKIEKLPQVLSVSIMSEGTENVSYQPPETSMGEGNEEFFRDESDDVPLRQASGKSIKNVSSDDDDTHKNRSTVKSLRKPKKTQTITSITLDRNNNEEQRGDDVNGGRRDVSSVSIDNVDDDTDLKPSRTLKSLRNLKKSQSNNIERNEHKEETMAPPRVIDDDDDDDKHLKSTHTKKLQKPKKSSSIPTAGVLKEELRQSIADPAPDPIHPYGETPSSSHPYGNGSDPETSNNNNESTRTLLSKNSSEEEKNISSPSIQQSVDHIDDTHSQLPPSSYSESMISTSSTFHHNSITDEMNDDRHISRYHEEEDVLINQSTSVKSFPEKNIHVSSDDDMHEKPSSVKKVRKPNKSTESRDKGDASSYRSKPDINDYTRTTNENLSSSSSIRPGIIESYTESIHPSPQAIVTSSLSEPTIISLEDQKGLELADAPLTRISAPESSPSRSTLMSHLMVSTSYDSDDKRKHMMSDDTYSPRLQSTSDEIEGGPLTSPLQTTKIFRNLTPQKKITEIRTMTDPPLKTGATIDSKPLIRRKRVTTRPTIAQTNDSVESDEEGNALSQATQTRPSKPILTDKIDDEFTRIATSMTFHDDLEDSGFFNDETSTMTNKGSEKHFDQSTPPIMSIPTNSFVKPPIKSNLNSEMNRKITGLSAEAQLAIENAMKTWEDGNESINPSKTKKKSSKSSKKKKSSNDDTSSLSRDDRKFDYDSETEF